MSTQARCRHCDTRLTLSLADLGVTPIANDYIAADKFLAMEPFYPLHVFVCSNCRLAQIQDFLKSDELFRDDYAYFSSFSTSWLDHADRYVAMMKERFGVTPESTWVEVASNDGYLLQYVMDAGINALGIEPCRSVADAAIEKGIDTKVSFFGTGFAQGLRQGGRGADVMTANNVLAHVPDINDFVGGFAALLNENGVATFEQQHLLRLMQNNQFDTVYHEHYSYLSLLAAQTIFRKAGLRIFDVEHLGSHGGSLRLFVCHEDAGHQETAAVRETLEEELAFGLDRDEVYTDWSANVRKTKRELLMLLIDLKSQGKSIAAYGAPAKGNTLLNYCGIGPDFIDFTADRAPSKQNHFLPGTRIPISQPDRILEEKPDYILILPWNLKKEIKEQLKQARDWGGKFIIPIPEPTVEE